MQPGDISRSDVPPRAAPLPPNFEPQMRQLQDTRDAMAIEIERIAQRQRVMAKVIGERERIPSLPPQKS